MAESVRWGASPWGKQLSPTRSEDSYKPIGNYGLISDMHSCALVGLDGSIDWCCFPRFDSASVFGRIPGPPPGGLFPR